VSSSNQGKTPSENRDKSPLRAILRKLRKRRIIETLAAFIGGGWLLVEVAERLLVGHYKFPDRTIDLTVVSVIGALLPTLVWRWFRGAEKRPRNVKVEVLLVPLIILAALTIDLTLVLQIAGLPGRTLLIGIVALCLGVAWVILKLAQWAAITPEFKKKEGALFVAPTIDFEKSIVVLPFKNISPEDGQEYFCDGMTEELITKLSMVRELRVISRTSAFMFKNAQKTAKEIASQLDVGFVLEGSVRKAGNKLRITTQLIDALKDTHLWSDTYDGDLEDVFDIQEKVSRAIVAGLKLQLTPAETRKMAERPIENLSAYECYLIATSAINGLTESSIHVALRNLDLAQQIVGENSVLYYGMGYAYWWLANLGIAIEENLDKCKVYARKALAIEPMSTKARALLGLAGIFYRGQKWPHEEYLTLKRVLDQDPNEPLALLALFFCYLYAGRISEAAPLAKRYATREPLSVWAFGMPIYLNWCEGQYERSLEEIQRVLGAFTDTSAMEWHRAWALAWLGRLNEAIAQADRCSQVAPNAVHTKLTLLLKHGLRGNVASARAELTPEFYQWSRRECFWSYLVADSLALADVKDVALEWLEHAVDLGFINYPLLAEKDPFLANLRTEHRFKKLMERVKYEWEHFEV
jgi:TolB-like protein/tetratricopeptide (TPR) repeat protein